MDSKAIDILELAKYMHGGYLVAKDPEIKFLKAALEDEEARDMGIKAALDFLYDESEESIWKNAKSHIKSLSEAEEIRRHIPEAMADFSPRGEGMEAEILFSYCVGTVATCKEEERLIPVLTKWLIDADWTGFKLAFHPSEEYLHAFTESRGFSQEYLVEKMKARREDLDSWQRHFDPLPMDGKIDYVNSPMFEDGCWQLIEYLDFLSALLIRNKEYDLLAHRAASYTIPEIQNALLSGVKDPDDMVRLFNAVAADGAVAEDRKRILLQIILNHWLRNLIRIKADQSLSLPGIHKDKSLDEIWKSFRIQFDGSLSDRIKGGLTEFLKCIAPNELTHWLFTIPMPQPLRENEQTKSTRTIIDLSRETLISLTSTSGFDRNVRDLSYLDVYARNCHKIEDKEYAYQLAEAIMESLFIDSKYLMGDVSNELLGRIHTLSGAIRNGIQKEAKEMFTSYKERFRVRYEGIKPMPSGERYDHAVIESQILMILLYMTVLNDSEEKKREAFKLIYGYTLRQTCAAVSSSLDRLYYLRVLVLAELIASQLLTDLKDGFESECILNYPDFRCLLQVFNSCQGPLSADACKWLQNQHAIEWPIIKKRMESRYQKDEIHWIEDVYKKIIANQSIHTHS